jgi:penicillin-binding protein 1C
MGKKRFFIGGIFLLIWYVWWFMLPDKLFNQPYATVLFGEQGGLLSARIASDDQWRFPPSDSLPEKYVQAVLLFEDASFFSHSGVRLDALVRAVYQNVKAGKVVSGASTISMQTIRLAFENPARTIWQKMKELVFALRLEVSYSKKQILNMYAAHAPFGGNVVGLDAASWRYFARPPTALSWADAAMLAVLPNAPGLMFPGKSNEQLLKKRNRLLFRLFEQKIIDKTTYQLAKLELLPSGIIPFPNEAPHAIQLSIKKGKAQQRIHTSIIKNLQQRTKQILTRYQQIYVQNQVANAAVVVVDNNTQQVLAYQGNVADLAEKYEGYNDMVQTPRSTGSILKPFLFAMLLQQGDITPYTLQPDIPMRLGRYSPENYVSRFEGAVPANEAIVRSLNVPAVKMLQQLTVPNFLHQLRQMGLTTLKQPASHYGLSLILGGGEATLWELTQLYSAFAQKLVGMGAKSMTLSNNEVSKELTFPLDVGVCYTVLKNLKNVKRPSTEIGWNFFSNQRKVAWKTGTSFGGRDAWAIGVDKNYTVGVWVGNADGEGRPALSGATHAGPILFEVFHVLPKASWFDKPEHGVVSTPLCAHSGNVKGAFCPTAIKEIPLASKGAQICTFCKPIMLNKANGLRISVGCSTPQDRELKNWFCLPPVMAWYYKQTHSDYLELPLWTTLCQPNTEINQIQLIYPYHNSTLKIPIGINGEKQKCVLQASHAQQNEIIYWHVDEMYLGMTQGNHSMEVSLEDGDHVLTLLDVHGSVLSRELKVK